MLDEEVKAEIETVYGMFGMLADWELNYYKTADGTSEEGMVKNYKKTTPNLTIMLKMKQGRLICKLSCGRRESPRQTWGFIRSIGTMWITPLMR